MIDQNEITEPHQVNSNGESIIKKNRTGNFTKQPYSGHTEIKIITQEYDFDALEQDWNDLTGKADAHIFQTFEWNRIWWKHFGAGKRLHILALYSGNKLVGIAPLFEDNVTLFGLNAYNCLRFLGSYVSQPEGESLKGCIPYSDYLDCIIHPRYERLFSKRILQYFKEVKSEYDEIILDEVPEKSALWNRMVPLIAKSNTGLNYRTDKASSSPEIQLNSTWDEYLNSLNVKDRYNARRYYKRSKRGNRKAFKIEKTEHPEEIHDLLNDFFRMHQQQWNSRGFAGTFSEIRMRDFLTEIAASFYEKGRIEINKAIPDKTDKKYVAMDIYLSYKNRVYLMHRGMEENSVYRKHGPGNVLLYARLKEAIDDGMQVVDMLRGTEEFKLRMATKINQNRRITILSGYKNERVLPYLVKKYLNIIRHIRTEELQIVIGFYGKPFIKGASDYIQFLHRRIKHKLFK